MSDPDEKDAMFSRNAYNQVMELFVIPELKYRQSNGDLPKPVDLYAVQVIFYPENRKPLVRINEEVVAKVEIKLKTGISKNIGDKVFGGDIESVSQVFISEDDLGDCGHITLLLLNGNWHIVFDLVYNKSMVGKHIFAACEFYQSAKNAFEDRKLHVFVDNLFSAYELAVKAFLLLGPDFDLRKKSTHGNIHSKYNRQLHLGLVERDSINSFNKLSGLRDRARYLKGDFILSDCDAQIMLNDAEEIIESVKLRV